VDEPELHELARQDQRIYESNFAIASPGKNVRITGIRDIVEPRLKVSGDGTVFPGIWDR
jgi:Glycine/sarcosine/betaine reductase component B subunits